MLVNYGWSPLKVFKKPCDPPPKYSDPRPPPPQAINNDRSLRGSLRYSWINRREKVDTAGVFHLPKDSGNSENFGGKCLLVKNVFHLTHVPSISFSVRCIPHEKYKMAAQLLWLNEIVESVFRRRESREFKKL